ncbi:MAG: ABC transporter substrate-binding protein [Symbiopectobacterium sp.]
MNYAIDRQSMVTNLVKGGSKPVYTACFHEQVACDASKVINYPFDPQKTKQLLAEAGYPNGFDTDICAYRERDYAEAIVGYLRQVAFVLDCITCSFR